MKHLGKGAIISALLKFLHPSELIRNKFPNPVHGYRLSGCIALRQEVKKVNRKEQLCLVVHHEEFKTGDKYDELHAVVKHWKVHTEGDPDLFFTKRREAEGKQQEHEQTPLPAAIDDLLSNQVTTEQTIEALRGVVDIDDDNNPAPENVPTTATTSSSVFGNWGHDGICFSKQQGNQDHCASLNVPVDQNADDKNLQLFEILFPKKWMIEVVVPKTKEKLDDPLTYSELLRWIGLWLLMSTVDGSDHWSFWSTKNLNIFEGAPFRLNMFMTRNRFEKILNALTYTDCDSPAFRDRFWEVRQMIGAWNNNMTRNFSPSWKNCLDESMSKWLNEFTCPGLMFVPRKPWSFGNEWHDIGCADTNIIWQLEIREGKDQPKEIPKEHDDKGKTIGTLL